MGRKASFSLRPDHDPRPGWLTRAIRVLSRWLLGRRSEEPGAKGDFGPHAPVAEAEAALPSPLAEPILATGAAGSSQESPVAPLNPPSLGTRLDDTQEDAPASLSPEGLAFPEEQYPTAIEITANGPAYPLPVVPKAASWPAAAAEAVSDSAETQPLPSTAWAECTGEAGLLEGVPINGFSGERATAHSISSHIEDAVDSGPDPAWPSDPPQDTALSPVLPASDSEDSGQPAGGAPDLDPIPSASSTSALPPEIHSTRSAESSGTPEHADGSKLEPESPDPTLPGPDQDVDPAAPGDAAAPPAPSAAMEPADGSGDSGGVDPAEPVGPAAEPDAPREITPSDPPAPLGEVAATTVPLPKYRPQLREHQGGGAAKRTAAKVPAAPIQDAAASLEADLCLEFQPGDWGIRLSLLLRRPDAMPEKVTVRVLSRDMALAAIDGGLFEPIPLAENDAAVLWQGVSAHGTEEAQRRWVRSGRPLHVFSASAGRRARRAARRRTCAGRRSRCAAARLLDGRSSENPATPGAANRRGALSRPWR